ncbi:uncharacterized protein LOC100891103 [Strongylocentrotus purpuratus]|uniref:Uncharacterized protein n=1 Tax=Strongylocentrotus purpuratus TaxID=7668 RepID=A0A7M7NY99_STRPU|nr:uncharacterized protein LOC100891103 [Strongylocentrotus purpuratus]
MFVITGKILLITLLLFTVRQLVEGVRILPTGLVFHFDAIEDSFFGVYSCEVRVNDEEGEQVIRANFQLHPTPPPPPSVFPPSSTYRVPPNSVFEIIYGTVENGEPSIIYNGTEITDSNEEAYRLLKNESLDCTRSLVHLRILILDDTHVTFTESNLKYLIEPYDTYTNNEAKQRCGEWEDGSKVYSSLNEETARRNERHVKNYIPNPWNRTRREQNRGFCDHMKRPGLSDTRRVFSASVLLRRKQTRVNCLSRVKN